MRLVGEDNLDDLAVGAAILGTGGGGNPYIGTLLAKQAVREHGPVELVDVEEVPDDAVVVPSAMMGAPTVMVEKLPRGDEIIRAFKALMSIHEQKLDGDGNETGESEAVAPDPEVPLGDLEALQGVVRFPVRIKCATLSWNTLAQALDEAEAGAEAKAD